MKLQTGDKVIVNAGNDKGTTGTIIKVMREENKVLVEGVNLKKKHVKGRGDNEGGIVDVTHPIHASNVSLVDPKTEKATRVGYTITSKGKVRSTKGSGTEMPSAYKSNK